MTQTVVDEVMLRGEAPFEQMLQRWIRKGCTFVWGGNPTAPASWLVNRVNNHVGQLGASAKIGRTGIEYPDGVASNISWQSVFGVSHHLAMFALVLVNEVSDGGCFLKVGSTSNGAGIGIGSTSFDTNGSNATGLLEGRAWIPSSMTMRLGIRLIGLQTRLNLGILQLYGDSFATSNLTLYEPTTVTSISGYTAEADARYCKHQVIAAGVIPTDGSEAAGNAGVNIAFSDPLIPQLVGKPGLPDSVYW
jgi:hypothetical protein